MKLVKESPIATQGELREALKEAGSECDQATVSRDIKELNLVRVADESGQYRYTIIEEARPLARAPKLSILKSFIRSVESSGNMLVIITDAGSASPVAEAIDRLRLPEILGTVAGENTIFAVVKERVGARKVAEKLQRLINEEAK